MNELKANFNLYLTIKEGETQEEAEERLFTILNKVQDQEQLKDNDFSFSDMYKSEIQER